MNDYFLTYNKVPLMGAGYSYRYETCSTWCFIAPVAQVGFGVSTMGPFV